MSRILMMRLFRHVLAAVAALLALAGPAAASGPPEAGCAVFPWVQTYRGWGPSDHYGTTVTVVYDAASCEAGQDGDVATLQVAGTATIVKGGDADGSVLERRAFTNSASWTAADGDGWPIDWWSCEVDSLDYDWAIDGIYSFSMRAEGGRWSISVSPDSVDWAYAGC